MCLDLVHHAPDGTPLTVFDAKYKLARPEGRFSNADHYQARACCLFLGVDTAHLIYAAEQRHVTRKGEERRYLDPPVRAGPFRSTRCHPEPGEALHGGCDSR